MMTLTTVVDNVTEGPLMKCYVLACYVCQLALNCHCDPSNSLLSPLTIKRTVKSFVIFTHGLHSANTKRPHEASFVLLR